MDKETIGKLIRARRIEKGLSQKQLAKLIPVSLTTVSKWETGSNLPDILILDKIAKELDIPLADLLESGASIADEEAVSGGEESCNETEPAAPPPIHAVSDVPDSQSESLPGDAPPGNQSRPKARWMRGYAFVLSIIFIAMVIAIGVHLALEKRDEVFPAEICEEYQGEYEGESAYYIVMELNGEATTEELIAYNEDIRKQYEGQFVSVDLIIVIYTKDYAHYRENGFDETVDRRSILFP